MIIVNGILYLTIYFATDRPSRPEAPVETVETTSSLIVIKWKPPGDDGGLAVTNYIIERQQVGQSLWKKLGSMSAENTFFRDTNVTHGKKYNYRIYAENPEGLSDALETNGSIMAGVISECHKDHPIFSPNELIEKNIKPLNHTVYCTVLYTHCYALTAFVRIQKDFIYLNIQQYFTASFCQLDNIL